MSKVYKIRQTRIDDLDDLLNLLYQLSPPKNDEKIDKSRLGRILTKIIQDPDHYICVYETGGKILGTATLLIQSNLAHNGRSYGHIENVVTDKDHRGRGIGRKMTGYLVDTARKRHCYKVVLCCAGQVAPFYEKCLFKKKGFEMRIDI